MSFDFFLFPPVHFIHSVILATGSCPSETLKPGYENMSHYRFSFSRQERALKSIDFIKGKRETTWKFDTTSLFCVGYLLTSSQHHTEQNLFHFGQTNRTCLRNIWTCVICLPLGRINCGSGHVRVRLAVRYRSNYSRPATFADMTFIQHKHGRSMKVCAGSRSRVDGRQNRGC